MKERIQKNFCIVCNNKEPLFFGKKNEWNLWKCRHCKHVWVFPIPKNTKEIYNQDYFSGAHAGFGYVDYDKDKEPMHATFKKVLIKIETLTKKRGTLLDIGAATGFFMSIARSRGWDTRGTEISKYAAQRAKRKGLEVFYGDIRKAQFSQESFDVITMWDVIEHFSDPEKEVKKIVKLLKPEGIIFINTPDMGSVLGRFLKTRWHMMGPPEHLHYFNKKSIREFLKNNGLSIVSIGTVSKKFSCEYILQVLNNSYGVKWAGPIAKWTNRHPRIGNISLSINLYDNMAIYARKERSLINKKKF